MARSKLALGLGVLAALGAGACANLIGLDKFVDCTESPNQCDGGGPGDVDVPDTFVPDVVQPDAGPDGDAAPDADADADAQPPLPDGSVASDWAKYLVPHYDGGRVDASLLPGADAAIVGPGTVEGAFASGAVFDGGVYVNLRLLLTVPQTVSTWLRTPTEVIKSTFDQAQQHCSGLGGRVPTRIELLMLLDSTERPDGSAEPFMLRREVWPTMGLPVNYATGYWTSTVVRTDASVDFWVVDFKSGAVRRQPSSQMANWGVLCVK